MCGTAAGRAPRRASIGWSEMLGRNYTPQWLRHTTAGMEFILTFMAMLGAGILLDMRENCMPAFTLTGGTVGFGIALYRLVAQAREISRQADAKRQDKGDRT